MEASTRQRPQARSGLRFSSFSHGTRAGSGLDDSTVANTPPRAMGSWRTAGPGGNTQNAGSSVLAGRRLFNRSQNQPRLGSNTTRSFSDVPANTPGKVFAASSFRSGLTNGSSSKFTFSPRVPPNIMRESFPTVTPGRSFRGAAADMSGRAMSKTATTALFPMRIASPPPELDGEELAKQVPNNPDRVGSIYADEFLSHLVPPELDDLQRRQFFCILDLRRLKYAATEIFAKKDWRVNIMNFAKEYEKSRSLIMLRYGLYEFKTVPASRELLKKWKQENNVPDEDEEMADASTSKTNGAVTNLKSSMKRRADDDLTKDSASVSTSTPNKRRQTDREPLTKTAAPNSTAGATPFPKKTKRGAELMDEPDENQPHKSQKSKGSATLSIFEEVASNSPARQIPSPSKTSSKPSLSDSAAAKPQFSLFAQPPSGPSVLGGSSKLPASSGGNIFGHLSQDNTPMGSDDEESEAESDKDTAKGAASQGKTPAAATNGTSATTSLFEVKPSLPSNESSGTGNAFSNGPSLFDRVKKGPDGEPVRATESEAAKPSEQRPASPTKQSQPQNNTWNPNTPLKFGTTPGQTSTPLFGKPATQPSSMFSSVETPKPNDTPAFGTSVRDFGSETPKAAVPSLFSQTPKAPEPGASLFSSAPKTSLFGKPEDKMSAPAAAPSTPNLFAKQSQPAFGTTPFGKPLEEPSTQPQKETSIFANLNTPAATSQSSVPSLFGATASKPSTPLFGAPNGDKPSETPSLFGAKNGTEEKKEESAAKRKKPDSDATEQSAPKFSFGGGAPTPGEKLPPKTDAAAKGATDAAAVFGAPSGGATKFSFGAPAATPAAAPVAASADAPAPAPAPAATPIFGSTAPTQDEPAKTQPGSIFGSTTTPSSGFTFGSPAPAPASNPPSSLFGAPAPASNPPSSLFGAPANNGDKSNQTSAISFGSNVVPAANSFSFSAGGGASFNNPFASGGNDSQPPSSFDFSASSGPSSSTPFQFGGAPAPTTSSFAFGGNTQQLGNDNHTPSNNAFGGAATNSGSNMFSFGATQQPQQAGSNIFSNQPANAAEGIFASRLALPPAGSSTGTNTPLFGGASSIATTPAAGTPEPDAAKKNNANETADEDGTSQDQQVSLAGGGPGEEDEEVVHEVRAKALRLVPPKPDDDEDKDKKKTNPWRTEGLGPLRVLKHKTTGAVRMLLRAEPSGKVAMNKTVLPDFNYKVDKDAKWLKVTAVKDDGKGLETWMLQVKNNEFAVKLASSLEEHKVANKK